MYIYLYISVYIFIYICNEFIEEIARNRKLISACGNLLALAPLSSELDEMSTDHRIMTLLSSF